MQRALVVSALAIINLAAACVKTDSAPENRPPASPRIQNGSAPATSADLQSLADTFKHGMTLDTQGEPDDPKQRESYYRRIAENNKRMDQLLNKIRGDAAAP